MKKPVENWVERKVENWVAWMDISMAVLKVSSMVVSRDVLKVALKVVQRAF